MIYNIYFVDLLDYIVSEILVKKWKLLTLFTHGTKARHYMQKKIYIYIHLAAYMPLCGSNTACGG